MGNFFENPSFSAAMREREDFERIRSYQGDDTSFEILPHLNIGWRDLRLAYEKTGKPVGDLGASFSTLPVEGELQGIKVYPVDIMHIQGRSRYEAVLESRMINARMADAYTNSPYHQHLKKFMALPQQIESNEYGRRIHEAIQKARANYIVGDLAKIPLVDRFFSTTIAHDSLPKHTKDWETFITVQLPEILRVTDRAAHIYPMSIFRTQGKELVKTDPLFNNPEALERVQQTATSLGFSFQMRQAVEHSTMAGRLATQADPRDGVFERLK